MLNTTTPPGNGRRRVRDGDGRRLKSEFLRPESVRFEVIEEAVRLRELGKSIAALGSAAAAAARRRQVRSAIATINVVRELLRREVAVR